MPRTLLKLSNPEDFTTDTLTGFRFKKVEIELIDDHANGKPLYRIICIPNTRSYLHGHFSYSLDSLKKRVASEIRGYQQKEKLKWLKA